MEFAGFPDVEGFHNVVKHAGAYFGGEHRYRAKVKLHGTNAGVRIVNGEVGAQSRTSLLTPESDNAGFCRWVMENRDYFASLSFPDITIFGEWCGPGIMKGTAINQIPGKVFAVFAVVIGTGNDATVVSEPAKIEAMLKLPDGLAMCVLPWYGDVVTVNYDDRENLVAVAEQLNRCVLEVEAVDPWVKSQFGVEGIGEGLVYYPGAGADVTRKVFSDFIFKAKGEKHRVVKTKEAVQVDPEVAASIEQFVKMFVTEARCEQGLSAIGGTADAKLTGGFLKWLCQDVLKESGDELEASELTWDQVNKAVQTEARKWFLAKAAAI